MKLLVFLAAVLVVQAAKKKVDYTGHRVITAKPSDDKEVQALYALKIFAGDKLDFWNEHFSVNTDVMIRVPPNSWNMIQRNLNKAKVEYTTSIPDLQSEIDAQEESRRQRNPNPDLNNVDLEDFNRFDVINNWLDGTISTACGSRCSVQSIGQSFEGHDLRVIRIRGDGSATRSVFIDCGIHAREWLSPASCLWTIDAYVRRYGSDSRITSLLNNFDYYILPVANPDGYEYTFDFDRMWRKTRSDHGSALCPGADPNRNFGVDWSGPGTSSDPCSDTYHGVAPYSESECAAIRDFVQGLTRSGTVSAYVSIHTHGDWWLSPYGYSIDFPPDYDEQMRIGEAIRDNMADLGYGAEAYRVGTISHLLYLAAGNSVDWAYEELGIPYSITPELPGWGFGFVPSRDYIPYTSEEVLEAMTTMGEEILRGPLANRKNK